MRREDRDKPLHDRGIQPVLASSTLPVPAEETKPKGWALKVTKKATRFNEKPKNTSKKSFSYFRRRAIKSKQTVAQEMRYAKDEDGSSS